MTFSENERLMADNGGNRLGIDRRQNDNPGYEPERRSGRDRRRGFDRRSGLGRRRGLERRGGQNQKLHPIERRDAFRI